MALATNGADALKQTEAEPPDTIVLDLMMPVLDGWGFLTERSKRPDLARVPVVVLSAAIHQPEVLRARDAE